MSNTGAMRLLVHLPPPALYALTFLAGVGLQRLLPFGPAVPPLMALRLAGTALVAGAVVLAATSVLLFGYRRTTLNPAGVPRQFVGVGPYRFTRNPMYLSLTLAYVGVALLLWRLWPLLLLPLPLAAMQWAVIPFEERRLEQQFGDSYRTYRSRVRRWL